MPFGGVFSVLPTPFSASGDVDLDSLRRIVDLFIADRVDGFTALGVTSEVARLTEAERDRVLGTILAHVGGRLPVVAGTTADGLRTCIEILVKDVSLFRAGDVDDAAREFYAKVPLMRFE